MGEPKRRPAYLLDSNIFLRVFVKSDLQASQDCSMVLRAITENRIVAHIPHLVAIEVQFVLDSFYRFEKYQVIEAMKSMIATSNLHWRDDLSLPVAIQLFEEHNVKFVDCMLASSKFVQEEKASILSYDHDFDKLGVHRVEPRDLLKQLLKK